MKSWNSGATTFDVDGGDRETRPVNSYVNFIIKLNNAASVPVGSIISYAGADGAQAHPIRPWLQCNGNQYSIIEYPDLAKVTLGRYSTATNMVGVPKFTGKFLRGVDGNTGNDPDARERLPAPDGTKGDAVGTVQNYGTSPKGWSVSITHFPPDSSTKLYTISGHANLKESGLSRNYLFSGGAKESRPNNVSVDHYIYASSTSDPTNFPLGGIIGIPGDGEPDTRYWTLADGRSIETSTNPALFQVLQTAWGGAADGTSFNLPDLRDQFLRGLDLTPAAADDPLGDPDRWSRTASNPGGVTSGTGSKQSFATGQPHRSFTINKDYPTGKDNNAATAVGNDTSAFNSGASSYKLSGGDSETAPTNIAVFFYIKTANAS